MTDPDRTMAAGFAAVFITLVLAAIGLHFWIFHP